MLTTSATEKASIDSQLSAARKSLEELRGDQGRLLSNSNKMQTELLSLKQRNGELGAEVTFLNERLATERQQVEAIQEKFRKDFEAGARTCSTRFLRNLGYNLEFITDGRPERGTAKGTSASLT